MFKIEPATEMLAGLDRNAPRDVILLMQVAWVKGPCGGERRKNPADGEAAVGINDIVGSVVCILGGKIKERLLERGQM